MFKTLKYVTGFLALTFVAVTHLTISSVNALQPPSNLSGQGFDHYTARLQTIKKQRQLKHGVLFIGDSITEGCDWQQAFSNDASRNQGIGWDTSEGLKSRLHLASRHTPDKLLLLIGVNDLAKGTHPQSVAANVMASVNTLSRTMPGT